MSFNNKEQHRFENQLFGMFLTDHVHPPPPLLHFADVIPILSRKSIQNNYLPSLASSLFFLTTHDRFSVLLFFFFPSAFLILWFLLHLLANVVLPFSLLPVDEEIAQADGWMAGVSDAAATINTT
ncbi:hypothetical protein CEXT_556351 [Caerostris extrusa]|uniref:Uncharacterized protein n=1 Tax=Caerostris extrusa TaxID=172846 RepID=A0AAV4X0N9_CAEEX|nr:hypothetical protein CEXT_556351 [Caerostris extrusa]